MIRESIVSPYGTLLLAVVVFSGDISFNSDVFTCLPSLIYIQFKVKIFVFICPKTWIDQIFEKSVYENSVFMETWAWLNSCSVKGKLINLYIRQVRILSVLHRKHNLAIKQYFHSKIYFMIYLLLFIIIYLSFYYFIYFNSGKNSGTTINI